MKTFKDLIDSGIAPMRSKSWGKSTPADLSNPCHQLNNYYNNVYGVANSTHMDCHKDGHIITGHLLMQPADWYEFLQRSNWKGVQLPQPCGEWLESQGLCGTITNVDGSSAFVITHCELSQETPNTGVESQQES